jgi:hypothetical protein
MIEGVAQSRGRFTTTTLNLPAARPARFTKQAGELGFSRDKTNPNILQEIMLTNVARLFNRMQ